MFTDMKEGTREKFLAGLFVKISLHILGSDGHFARPRHRFAKFGNTQTAFVLGVPAFGEDDFRIGEHELGVRVFFEGGIDYRQTPGNADLGRCQPYAMCGIHGLEHVFDQLLQALFARYGAQIGDVLEQGIDAGERQHQQRLVFFLGRRAGRGKSSVTAGSTRQSIAARSKTSRASSFHEHEPAAVRWWMPGAPGCSGLVVESPP